MLSFELGFTTDITVFRRSEGRGLLFNACTFALHQRTDKSVIASVQPQGCLACLVEKVRVTALLQVQKPVTGPVVSLGRHAGRVEDAAYQLPIY